MKDRNFGIGADIESIDHFRNFKYDKNNRFLNNTFTKNELEYCFSKQEPSPHLAARFAGKEAVFKALNGICKVNPRYNQIEIINDENGVPFVKLHNKSTQSIQVFLSLAHCEDKALAFAVLTEVDNDGKW